MSVEDVCGMEQMMYDDFRSLEDVCGMEQRMCVENVFVGRRVWKMCFGKMCVEDVCRMKETR